MKKVFSFDAETNGLWGKVFAIGALVYNQNGNEVTRFVGRLSDLEITDVWVRKNVLPKLSGIPVTHKSYEAMLVDFAAFYMAHKADADIVVHMGYIVEAKVLRDMHDAGLIGDWDGPYPLFDISGNLQAAGADPTNANKFVLEHGLSDSVEKFAGGRHNPFYDAAVTAAVYCYLITKNV
jgi:hypothetical protein